MARRDDDQPRQLFDGFDKPESNWFRMPNSWTDITAGINSIAELKVVEYILRHTWGYQEYGEKKHITIDEFVNGRRRYDGSRMDRGTGLSERAVYDGLRKAVEDGLIEEETDDSDRGRIKKSYSLRMRDETAPEKSSPPDLQDLQSGVQSLHPPLQSLPPRGAAFAPRSEKDTRERNYNHFEFRKVNPDVDNSGDDSEGSEPPPRVPSQPTHTGGIPSIGEVIEGRHAAATGSVHRRGRPPGTGDEREQLRAFLADFSRELHDAAPLSSTITRVLRLFREVGLPRERWGDVLYQARAITQEHSAQITTPAGEGHARGTRNKVPYFLAVVESLVGLRPAEEAQFPVVAPAPPSRARRSGQGI